MSTTVPKTASFELKSRNVAYRERRTHSIQPSTGSGTYAGTTGRSEIKFNIPASHLAEPRGCYLRYKVRLQVGASGGDITDDFVAFLNGSAASVFRELEIKNGSGDILERVENVDQIALFNCRAKSQSWRENQGRQLMGFAPLVDQNINTPHTGAVLEPSSTLIYTGTVTDGFSVSRTFEYCVPLCMVSGLFSLDKVLPLKYMNRSGGPAITVELRLHDKKYCMYVANSSTGAAVGNLSDNTTFFEIDSPELVLEELVPTAVYDQALAQSIAEAGSDGLKLFYRANSGYNLSTGNNSGSEFTINIPLYEFSIGHMVSWFRASSTPQFQDVNVTNWQSGGVTRAQSSFGSYTMPTNGIDFENPANQNSNERRNNARGMIELSKVIGKVCGEGSSGFKKYEISAEDAAAGGTAIVDDAYHRVYAFNYDVIDNMLQDPPMQISGVDNRSSSLPAVIKFNKSGVAPFNANYIVQVYIAADRLLSITADRGAVSGVTA